MIDFNKLGRDLWSARFILEAASNNLVGDDRIAEDLLEDHLEMIDHASAGLKAICEAIAPASEEFCAGYVEADREAKARGQQWSDERAEKIALLRLSGDDTPEEQIP